MATTHYPGLSTWRIAISITTALFGTLAAGTGLYACLNAGPNVANLFGIMTPPSISSNPEASARQKAWIQVYGIRNLVSSFSGLGLVAFWRFSPQCQNSPAAANAIQKAIAIVFGVGSIVAIGDGLIVGRFGRSHGLSAEQKKLAEEKAPGHIFVVLPLIPLALGWLYL